MWLFVADEQDLAVAIFALAAWTDFFDGYIARRTGSITELGKLLDPLADRVLIAALAIALLATDVLPLWLALVVVGRDVIVLSLFPLLERRRIERIRVNRVGKTATGFLFFGLTWLALSETSLSFADVGEGLGLGFTVAGAVLYWVAGGLYAREALGKIAAQRTGGEG